MSDLYREYRVHSVTPHHASDARFVDNFSLVLVPEEVDPDRLYGAQLTYERFTPTSEPRPDAFRGQVYDGRIGDPDTPQEAMLTIDTLAQARNKRRQSNGAAVMRGVEHDFEGSLIVFSATDQ